jgi:P-type Cu+ transporter
VPVSHWFMSTKAAIAMSAASCPTEVGGVASDRTAVEPRCHHCGTLCGGSTYRKGDKAFCCQGCLTVFELLTENGLGQFYELGGALGVKAGEPAQAEQFQFVDEPGVRERLVDYSDERLTRVRFRLPAIHCIACVWLLENLFRLRAGLGGSEVNFPRKELALSFETGAVKLSEVVCLLTSLGYEPELRLSDLQPGRRAIGPRRLWVQIGLAGFAFGNTMLFSVASYLGLDSASGPGFQKVVGIISLLLAVPVLAYSALDYWRSAWISLRRGLLNIDVPIAAGIVALAGQSSYDVFSGRGVGYFDSLAGLLFFLLCGKLFQQKTFDRLAFDRDYRSFFPLSVQRRTVEGEQAISVLQVRVGDELVIRNGELIPADARVVDGPAMIDYSFVTGESEPVGRPVGEYVYAGGRQMGAAVRVQVTKDVSQGYLTSLWNQEAFRKEPRGESLDTVTNLYSQRFTKLVIGIAFGAALFWASVDPALSVKSFISVLIVACPCALALAAPFAFGTAQRVLARRSVFLKHSSVLESLARARAIVFDKTGTLTAGLGEVGFQGRQLNGAEAQWVAALTQHSVHPQALRVRQFLSGKGPALTVRGFQEVPGLGIEGVVNGHRLCLGSATWLGSRGVKVTPAADGTGSLVHFAIDGAYRGAFQLANSLRPDTDRLLAHLAKEYELSLLSGDTDRDQQRFRALLGPAAQLRFNQSPLDKLMFIRGRQQSGQMVIMVGDGLNDAGALQQSDVGIAVVENISAFSPASDVIMTVAMLPQLDQVARFSKATMHVTRASFALSAVYNVLGIAIAAQGLLAPVVCAVLMPLSSVTVVLFACGATAWIGQRWLGPVSSEANPAADWDRSGARAEDVVLAGGALQVPAAEVAA